MAAKKKTDPCEAMRIAARAMDGVAEGTACSQTSFKVGGTGFFYVGEQGGRFKAMFKLRDSIEQAQAMAADAPDDIQIGTHGWVTARFSAAQPLPVRLWKKWLKESYNLASG